MILSIEIRAYLSALLAIKLKKSTPSKTGGLVQSKEINLYLILHNSKPLQIKSK